MFGNMGRVMAMMAAAQASKVFGARSIERVITQGYKRGTRYISKNKFTPADSNGERECARRIRQMAHVTDKKVVVAINHMTFG